MAIFNFFYFTHLYAIKNNIYFLIDVAMGGRAAEEIFLGNDEITVKL